MHEKCRFYNVKVGPYTEEEEMLWTANGFTRGGTDNVYRNHTATQGNRSFGTYQ